MTHLSDFSYVDRLVTNLLVFPVWSYYVFYLHKALRECNKEHLRKNLRLGVALFYFLAYLSEIAYDIVATWLKYREGFLDTCLINNKTGAIHRYPKEAFDNKESGHYEWDGPTHIDVAYTNSGGCGIAQTPAWMYSEESAAVLPFIDALWNLSCTLRNSGLFLLLAWFNSTIKDVAPNLESTIQRWEVRVFAFYSLFSLAWYFILPTMFEDELISTISTQILWCVELFVAGLMLIVTNIRIKRLLINASDITTAILEYTKVFNYILITICFGESIGLLSLNIDILLVDRRVLYNSKLLTDLFTKTVNFFYLLEPIIVALLLYKPRIFTRFVRLKSISRSSRVRRDDYEDDDDTIDLNNNNYNTSKKTLKNTTSSGMPSFEQVALV